MILDKLKSPNDLSDLSQNEISLLCDEIRTRIIQVTSKNGGHVGPNLGVVELTIALHLVFDSPQDCFVWDVSHQGYVHKLLTGRNDLSFDHLRQTEGYSGFLSREESVHDSYGAGHAGTALSAALGMCAARDIQNKKNHVVAIAGDAAFTCGITLEAINNIASTTKRFILILNDNEWSIAKNVGALSKYFNELITNPVYSKFHKDAENFLNQVPGGPSFMKLISKAKRETKDLIAPSSIFEKFGLRYLGPIDGHDIPSMVHFLEFAKKSEEPIILHLLTQKGKGFPAAINEPEKWHGASPFDPKTGNHISTPTNSPPKYQDIFGQTLTDIAIKDERVVAITAAMPSGTGLDIFQASLPDRFYDVGIAEEHAVLLASGMATQGIRPVCAIYSTFIQRAYDQIIHDVCLQNLPVTFCLDRAGLSPNDGPTHHGVFDISFLRCLPNAILMQPKNEAELQSMLLTAVNSGKPSFIRYPRGSGTGAPLSKPSLLEIGKSECLMKGRDWSFWALGGFVELAEKLAKYFEHQHGISCSVVNARFVKPLDKELFLEHCKNHSMLISLEDNVIHGGFGSALLEEMNHLESRPKLIRFGWPDKFIEHGTSVSQLKKKYRLDFDGIIDELSAYIEAYQTRDQKVPVESSM